MPRGLVIGKGRLQVNFDNQYGLRDLFYPNGARKIILPARNAIAGSGLTAASPGWKVRPGRRNWAI
jgi:hypothetical protein